MLKVSGDRGGGVRLGTVVEGMAAAMQVGAGGAVTAGAAAVPGVMGEASGVMEAGSGAMEAETEAPVRTVW